MGLLDLLIPVDCAGCAAPGAVVCGACRTVLGASPQPAWPSPSPPGLPRPWAVAPYDGAVRQLLLAVKERGATSLLRPLGDALAASVVAAVEGDAGPSPAGPLLLVPVPSTRTAVRARGDDVVARLTARAAARTRRDGVRVQCVPALHHVRAVRDSAGLSAAERRSNRQGALGVRPVARRRVDGATVVLADDLVTTGATLADAASALRRSGARVVAAAVVAATPRRGVYGQG